MKQITAIYQKRCPSDETLMDFLEGRLGGRKNLQVEAHLAVCAKCREQVWVCSMICTSDDAARTEPVAEHVTQRAVDAVAQLGSKSNPHGLFQAAYQRLIKGVADLELKALPCICAPAPVRSGGPVAKNMVVKRNKSFGDLEVTVEIEKSGRRQATIRVTISGPQSMSGPVRVALYKNDREAASMLVGEAAVLFEEIPFGVYSLVFACGAEKFGEYTFEISDQCVSECHTQGSALGKTAP